MLLSLDKATKGDFELAGSWLTTQDECDLWSGGRVTFPIEPEQLWGAIQWNEALNYSLKRGSELVGVGQLIKKEIQRLHLARILVHPTHRGLGFGRQLIERLVEAGFSNAPRCLSLNVHPHNAVAIALYKSVGFEPAVNPSELRSGEFQYMECVRAR